MEVNKKGYFKYYLGQFFRESIYKEVYDRVKNYSFDSNLIIRTKDDTEIIASIVSSFWMQHKDLIDFHATNLYGVVQAQFNEVGNNEGISDLKYMMESKTHLIIYEMGDSNNKLYPELLTMTFNNRILNEKYNMLILTHRTPEELLDVEFLKKFIIVDFTDLKISCGNKSYKQIY